jgi:hypothetical protein
MLKITIATTKNAMGSIAARVIGIMPKCMDFTKP